MATPAPKTPAPAKAPSTHDKIVTGSRAVQQAVPSGGKPSTVRSAVAGAAGGAATGAAVGSVVPVVGTAVGAGAGAAIGGAGGAAKAHFSKRDAKRARRAALGPARQLLTAEFVICVAILAFSPLTDKHKSEGPQAFLRRGAAICALFFILGLVSSGGRGATKVAAGFGGLVTLTLLVSSRDVFAVLAKKFNSTKEGPAGPDGSDAGTEEITPETSIGSAVQSVEQQVGVETAAARIGQIGQTFGQVLGQLGSPGRFQGP